MPRETAQPNAQGTIVLCNSVGRARRKQPAAVSACSVIDCSGEFHAGDTVNVTFRGVDGGQFAIATAVANIDAAELRRRICVGSSAETAQSDHVLAITEENLRLLWPPSIS